MDAGKHTYELMDGQNQEMNKLHVYELIDAGKHAYELMDGQNQEMNKVHAYELMDCRKTCVRADGWTKSGDEQNSCVRAYGCMKSENPQKSCVRVGDFQISVRFVESQTSCKNKSCVGVRKNDGVVITANDQRNCRIHEKVPVVGVRKNDGVEITTNDSGNRRCHDADVTPIVRDLLDDDRILVESGAEITLFRLSLPSPRK